MKKILNIFALSAVVLAFSALVSSCQKEDAAIEAPQEEAKEVHVFHVELDAAVADDTKASYSSDTKLVSFEEGDSLYVTLTEPNGAGWSDAKGTLAYNGTTFAGDIEYTGTYSGKNIITDAKDLTANFLPKGYSEVGYLTSTGETEYEDWVIDEYGDEYEATLSTADRAFYAGEKSKSVAHLAHFTATITDKAGVKKSPITLTAQNALLSYEIAADQISAGEHKVIVSNGNGFLITGNVTAVAGEATKFAVAFPADATPRDYTLDILGEKFAKWDTKSGKTITAGTVYNISISCFKEDPNLLSGWFSVSPTKQVRFSKGNLMATTTDLGESWKWKCADNQYDIVGKDAAANNCITAPGKVSENGTVDLFGWVGKDSPLEGDAAYGICSSSADIEGQPSYDPSTPYGTESLELKYDWGTCIDGNGWRTLSGEEWHYLIYNHLWNAPYYEIADEPILFWLEDPVLEENVRILINGVYGLILYPNHYFGPLYDKYLNNWNECEAAGCVFLPFDDMRKIDIIPTYWSPSYTKRENILYKNYGAYWSSTGSYTSPFTNQYNANAVLGYILTGDFKSQWGPRNWSFELYTPSPVTFDAHYASRANGSHVRLVKDI